MQIKISLNNSAGELDSLVVKTEAEVKAAIIQLVSSDWELRVGDTITVANVKHPVETYRGNPL